MGNHSWVNGVCQMSMVSVIILNRNNAKDVVQLYHELLLQSYQDFNVIVVDDNSIDSENDILCSIKDQRLSVYPYPEPWKFGHDNEYMMALSIAIGNNAKYIYVLQTDMNIRSIDLLKELVLFMEQNEAYGLIGPTITHNGRISWGPEIKRDRMGLENIVSESFMIRSTCVSEMGRINQRLRYFGFEHYLKFWMRDNGYLSAILGNVEVEHSHGGTSSNYVNYKVYYRPRTTILIMKLFLKNVPMLKKLKYFDYEMYEIKLLLKQAMKRVKILNVVKMSVFFLSGLIAGLYIDVDE